MQTPVSIYVVHHPACIAAQDLAKSLYDWFRLGYLSGDSSGAGMPLYFRRQLDANGSLLPELEFKHAALNVVIVLVDQKLVVDEKWRAARLPHGWGAACKDGPPESGIGVGVAAAIPRQKGNFPGESGEDLPAPCGEGPIRVLRCGALFVSSH